MVFVNRKNLIGQSCCSKLTFSAVGKLVHKAAILCTAEARITSRILRRSQITALWQRNDDPTWRTKVAVQCGHSLQTASRYYEFSEKVIPGMEVVQTLQNMREEGNEEEDAAQDAHFREP